MIQRSVLLIACLVAVLLVWYLKNVSLVSKTNKISIGALAPDFTLLDETNTPRTLSSMRGSRVAIYFYPKDETPGCTAQACSIRDNMVDLAQEGIKVWGINYDSPSSHALFKERHALAFPLLSDSDKKVSVLYGVSGILFVDRTTFLIDENGIIVDIITNVDTAHHAEQILQGFKKARN